MIYIYIYIYTGWNDKIFRPRKDVLFPFPFNENRFSFFVADHLLVGQLCTNPKNDRRLLLCLKVSDTMFNEQDRRCTAVQLMHSTDPNYDNRTIANTLKMQIWIATNNRDVPRVMKTKFPATVMVFGVVSSEGHIMPLHIFEVGLKVNTKVYLDVLKSVVIPWCNQVPGSRPWVWQQDSAPAHKSKETQAWLQECYDFVPFSHCPPSSPDLNPLYNFVWSYAENITNMTSHNTKADLIAAIRRLWKRHAPSSGSVSRRWLRLKAATLNICQLYYIIKLPELIFSIKVLK